MPRSLLPQVRACGRFLIEQRLLMSFGFAIAAGVVLRSEFAVSTHDPLLAEVRPLSQPTFAFVLDSETV